VDATAPSWILKTYIVSTCTAWYGSFSDSGYTFAFLLGYDAIMRTQHRETASISEMAQPPRTDSDDHQEHSSDFCFTGFQFFESSSDLGLQITGKWWFDTLYDLFLAAGSSGTETMSTYSELFGRVTKL
jgi:hypothetical protein